MKETLSFPAAPYRALQSLQVDVAEGNEKLAARRGILMAILCILACSDEQVIAEEELFKILSLDSRLDEVNKGAGEDAKGSGGKRPRVQAHGSGDLTVFDDQGSGAVVLAHWQDMIKRLVSASYLNRTKRKFETEEGGAGAAEEWIIGVGPASRMHVGMLGAVEVVRTMKGDAPELVGIHTKKKTALAMAVEVGEFSKQNHLPEDEYSLRDFAEEESGAEREEGEE